MDQKKTKRKYKVSTDDFFLDPKKIKSTREINNEFFEEAIPKGSFNELPSRKYLVADYVQPKNVKNLSSDEYITFEIKTSERELLFFPDDYQVYIEVNPWTQINVPAAGNDPARVDNIRIDVAKSARWPISTNALVLFDKCEIWFNHSQNMKTLFSPVEGKNFLNIKQTQDLLLNPSLKNIEEQFELGNIINSNRYILANLNTMDKKISAKMNEKMPTNQTDGPEHDNIGTASFLGKACYLNINMFPFQTVSPYIAEKYKIKRHSMIPPNSNLKVILHRNPLKGENLMPTTAVSPKLESENSENRAVNSYAISPLNININKILLRCFRMKALHHEIPPSIKNFEYNLQTTFFDLIPLGEHTQQTHKPAWKYNKTPVYCVISFLRENDILPRASWIQVQASNYFYKPQNLRSLTVRCTDFKNETLDNISINNLDVSDSHKSKLAYLDYLKINNFVHSNIKFEDFFSVSETSKEGQLNLFPINLNGSELPKETFLNGLQIDLNFKAALTTKWYMLVRYDYLGVGKYYPKEKKHIFKTFPNFSI